MFWGNHHLRKHPCKDVKPASIGKFHHCQTTPTIFFHNKRPQTDLSLPPVRGEFFPHLRKWWKLDSHGNIFMMIKTLKLKKKHVQATTSDNSLMSFPGCLNKNFELGATLSYICKTLGKLDTTGGNLQELQPFNEGPNFRFPGFPAPVFCRRHLVHRHPRGSMPLVWFRFPHIEIPVFQRLRWFHRSFKHRTHSLNPRPPKHLDECKVQRMQQKKPTKLRITKTHRISTTLHTSGSTGKSKASRHKVSAEKTKVVKIDASINTSYSLVNQRLLMVI